MVEELDAATKEDCRRIHEDLTYQLNDIKDQIDDVELKLGMHDKQAAQILNRVSDQHGDLDEIKAVVLETVKIQREQAILGKLSEERMSKNDERMFKVTMRLVYFLGAVITSLLAFFFGTEYIGLGK